MRVLITDSDNRSALASTRALGVGGHTVITAGDRHPSLASVSRYSSGSEIYPNPVSDPDGFVSAVVEIAQRQRIDVVLPMTEITTLLLTQNQSALPSGCQLPFPAPEVVSNASNKAYVMTAARALGVPIPETTIVESLAEVEALAATLSYPAVMKASRSRVRTPSGWISTGVGYANDRSAFVAAMKKLRPEEYPILVQERIYGPGVGVFACFDRGAPLAWFNHRRIREKPPSGGVSVLRESAPLDPIAVDYANRLLSHLGWRGVAMVEFKRDNRDGSLRLMEINGRFWGSLQLAIDAGVDFPSMLVG
ncbi:MAG: ATP-grasp domain-containing protein, partial [Candidatus Obscuribacterales bacterium]|nr:ATP-grasp domain-containing protein [Steroidobacteraceae bacterium]